MENRNRIENNIVIKHPFILMFFTAKNPFWALIGALPLFIYFSIKIKHFELIGIVGVLAGIFLWTFLEYAIHRWMYHINIQNHKIRYVVDSFHFYHHKKMNDRRVLNSGFLTLYFVGFILLTPFYYFFELINQVQIFYYFAFGILAGNQFYEFVHFQIHYKIHKKGYLRFIQQYHLHHHQVNWHTNFGNTSSFWDRVFKTYDARYCDIKFNEQIKHHFIKY